MVVGVDGGWEEGVFVVISALIVVSLLIDSVNVIGVTICISICICICLYVRIDNFR